MPKKVLWSFIKMTTLFGGLFLLFFIGMEVLPEKQRNQWFYKENKASLLSVEQEILLGEKIEKHVLQNPKVYNQAVMDSALWVILTRLEQEIEFSDYDYTLKIIDSPEINAFTIPGGRIFIYKGLLVFCDSPEQVAAVLAHEIAHVEKRHTVSKLIKEFGITLLFSILSGGDAILLSDLFQATVSTSFDRANEREADDFALALLEKAQISPSSMASFFRKLNRENRAYNENIEFLMTHPHNNARIKRSLNYQVKDSFSSKPLGLNWQEIKEEVK